MQVFARFTVASSVLLLFTSFLPLPASADGTKSIPIGVARIDITPDTPIRMTGYAGRKMESEGVEQRLWAKALAWGSDADGPAVLVTVDNLGVPGSMADALAEQLKKKTGVSRERLTICSSHTHTGPVLAGVAEMILSDTASEAQWQTIQRYTQQLGERLEEVALQALADRRPGQFAWAQGKVEFAVNRRVLKEGRWTGFGVVPEGPVDFALPVLRATDADGKLRAVLVNYACHCTTLGPKFNKICGDWAGYAQEMIEREHPGATAMIAIGCGADANPNPRDDHAYAIQHGDALAREVKRLLSGPLKPITGKFTARFERIELPFAALPTREEWTERTKQKGPIAFHAQTNLARLDRGEKLPTKLSYPVQAWSFGDDLAMVFLGGEVVVDYALRLKRECVGDRLWVSAYSNDVPCYIASKRVLAEGGYEVDSSMYYYDRPQHFVPEIEDQIIGTVRKLLPASYLRKE
jgi:hypothetical protein